MEFKVLVTTSGTGSRLGELTKYTNKALVKVGKKPVISYIIENYPKNTEFVVTLGYFGDQVRDFLALAYPELRVTFVDVDTYQGEGSSLGYSMLQAKEHLQCPFIYQACDTIVTEPIDAPGRNWIAGFRGQGSSQYASFDSINGKLQKIYDKGMMDPDYIHIGLVGINDYENFWKFLEKAYSDDPKNSSLNDVDALRLLVSQGITFDVKGYKEWHDIGNVESLHNARKNIKDEFRILDKPEESIFIFNDFVIKFFSDKNIAIDRVKRAKNLEGIVPNILASTENFYKYEYSTGALYADVANSIDITSLVTWGEKNLWKETSEVSQEDFKKVCLDFYCTKTKKRVEQFFATRSIADTEHVINGQQVPTIQELLQQVDFDYLAIAEQTGFHGDFILDNILKTDNDFMLLDWRQNFGGLLTSGDKYYDLAKLNHNLFLNHHVLNENLFSFEMHDKRITLDVMRSQRLIEAQSIYMNYLETHNYDIKKINLLTPIIWLNMAPLHQHPLDLFLFYFGKYQLWKALQEYEQ